MSIRHRTLQVSKTAHYSTFGTLDKQHTKFIWMVCHGYGQLARKMISRFDHLDPIEHFVIAPEGLSRFYWHTNNTPVASWMTSEDRYDEIEDLVNYLDGIYNRYCRHVNQSRVRIILFGFSQGCATLWRWIHARQPRFDSFINWAGWIPEDLSYSHLHSYLQSKKVMLHYGSKDHFITKDTVNQITDVIHDQKLNVRISQFEGGHVIPKKELISFIQDHILD